MRLAAVILIALIALPAAAAQAPATAARPSLVAEPGPREVPPGGALNVSLLLSNPLERPITWALNGFATEARVNFEKWEITVAPRSQERVQARAQFSNSTNVTHNVTFMAQETSASATGAGRSAPLALQTSVFVRVPAAPPRIEMRIDPPLIALPSGGNASVLLVIANGGAPIEAPSFEIKPMPGVEVHVLDAPERIPTGSQTRVRLLVIETGAHPVGARLDGAIGIRGAVAIAPIHVEITPPLAREPSLGQTPPADRATAAQPPERAAPGASAPPSPLSDDPRVLAAAGLAAAGSLWTALWLSRRKWLPLLAALYTRLKPSGLLDHPLRKRIADLVQARPGITFSDLARQLDIAPGQLTHHARMLERGGIVFSSPDGQTRRFFHIGHGRIAHVPPLAERALTLVKQQPRKASDVARELGVSRQALHYHVQKLVADGRLVAKPDGREVWLEATA